MNLLQVAENQESLPFEYESWSAQHKQSFLWNERILPSRYDQLPPLQKIDLIGLVLTPLRKKMDRSVDEAPMGWKKAIHAHGSVAKIQFIAVADTPFTGLLKGADYGFLRLSVTSDPIIQGFAPGLAIKFFVDGKPSANFSALVSLEGQGQNYNLFANEFSNIVPPSRHLGPKLINFIFRRVSRYPTQLYLQNLATVEQNGQTVTHPHHPYQLFLVPNPDVQFAVSLPHDFRQDLLTIAPGTQLFSVYGVDPKQVTDRSIGQPEYRQQAQLMGHLETTSEFVASEYGDRRLFFRHQRFCNQ